jgi:glycosyltransferase involved in cell wall biosynthesis
MSTDQPTVTIITPAYNVARFLSQTIESALAQTFGDFELLISDDGSTDETLEVALGWERVDPRIRVIVAPNGGSATARNRAMKEARGSYFALLDSDDLWQPGFLAAQLAIFHQNPDADVVTANAYNMGGSSDGRPLKPVGVPCRKLTLLEIVENEDAICIMSVFRRAVFDRIGGFDTELRYCEDYAYWVRAAHAGFVFFVNPEPLAYYRRRSDSKSASEVAHLNGVVLVYRHVGIVCQDRPVERAAIARQLARFEREYVFITAKFHLLHGDFEAAAKRFEQLSGMTHRPATAMIARLSRHVPRALLWAYRAKSAWRGLHRSPLAG